MFVNERRKRDRFDVFDVVCLLHFLATRCPRCQVEKHYLNVLVVHVLLDQCENHSSRVEERIVVRTSANKKRLDERSSSRSAINNNNNNNKNDNNEEHKVNDTHRVLTPNEISSYKMSVLDGTHALEFTSLDTDGRQRKAHLCLFCGKVKNSTFKSMLIVFLSWF